jgi:magnesium chelatase family protein
MKSVLSCLANDILDGTLIKIECRLTNSLPAIVIVGETHRSVREAKERIRGTLASCGMRMPAKRIIIHLAPADIPKHGSILDLAMFVSMIVQSKIVRQPPPPGTIILGELSLSGKLEPVKNIIGAVTSARRLGYKTFWIPMANIEQVQHIANVTCHPFSHASEVIQALNDYGALPQPVTYQKLHIKPKPYYDTVSGQAFAKRALCIALAGQHPLLLLGPVGTGKSLLARQAPTLLPVMQTSEALAVSHMQGLVDSIETERPLITPPASITRLKLLGTSGVPGLLARAKHGVVLFDELTEFQRNTLEALRTPLDMPIDYHFIATANPCACGNFGSTWASCTCSGQQLHRYQNKLSAPLLDRIDIQCRTEPIQHQNLVSKPRVNYSLPARIQAAQNRQYKRQSALNSQLTNHQLHEVLYLEPQTQEFIATAIENLKLSGRRHVKTLTVARTIADLEGDAIVRQSHIAEALQYTRPL